jgi:hypothetical protein
VEDCIDARIDALVPDGAKGRNVPNPFVGLVADEVIGFDFGCFGSYRPSGLVTACEAHLQPGDPVRSLKGHLGNRRLQCNV